MSASANLPTEHDPGLLRLATTLANPDTAQDLVQDTWVRALQHGQRVQRPRTWLRQVLRNERKMTLRGQERRDAREHAASSLREEPMGVEDVVSTLQVARVVHQLVDELDLEVRTVVQERYFEGDSAADIARRHNIPAGTVRWRLKKGLEQLRGQLDQRYGGRRALWAGALIPSSVVPTLGSTAASGTMGGNAAAPGTGMSAMITKTILGISLLAAGAGAVVVSANMGSDAEQASTPELSPPSTQMPSSSATTQKLAAVDPQSKHNRHARARWNKLRAGITQAHALAIQQQPTVAAGPQEHNVEHECEDDNCIGVCDDKECLTELAEQVVGLLSGCHEEAEHLEGSVELSATVIGAPDVGMIVEDVELKGVDNLPPELTECLTESMYDLDLGEAEANIRQEITIAVAGNKEELSEANKERLRAVGLDEATTNGKHHRELTLMRTIEDGKVTEEEVVRHADNKEVRDVEMLIVAGDEPEAK